MSQHPPTGLLTDIDAAHLAGVSRATVGGWIASGLLPVIRIDGRRYIRPGDLQTAHAVAHLGGVLPAWREDRSHAGWRLRVLREAAGLTQLDLAAASGLTHETISRVELGQQGPSAATVRVLARALGVEPEQFVGYDPLRPTLLTTAEAGTQLDVPARRVQTWLRGGLLEGIKVSGQWRVPAIAVYELARSERLRGRSRRLDPRYRG